MHVRALAPAFVKRIIWDHKPMNQETRGDLCPPDFSAFLLQQLRPTDSLLDFGCGPGNLLVALRTGGWQGHYIGVDVSAKGINLGRDIGDKNSEWHVGLIEDFPVRVVAAVSFMESLYYARNVPKVLSQWEQADIYVRMFHTDRHADVISQLSGFTRHTPAIWSQTSLRNQCHKD